MTSGCSTAKGAVSGHKKNKMRIMFLVCYNADGSEKITLMVIGTALNSRPFKKKVRASAGFRLLWEQEGLDEHQAHLGWVDPLRQLYR